MTERPELSYPIELQILLQAREIVERCGTTELDAAITLVRANLVANCTRKQYLHTILPVSLVFGLPDPDELLVAECTDGHRIRLQHPILPPLCQILLLENEQGVQVTRIIHHDGRRQWTYCL